MEKIELKIKTESPLLIKANNDQSNLVQTMDYIPGSQIWGTLAQYFLEDELYEELFLSSKVKFNNLYKSGAKIIPLSALSCKYYDGFISESGENHGVYDILLDRLKLYKGELYEDGLLSHCQEKITKSDKLLGSRIKDKPCNAVLKSFSGYYTKKDGAYQEEEITKRRIEKTALNIKDNTAKQGSLYVLEAITAGQEFSGSIEINSDKKELATKLKEVLEGIDIEYFGSAKSRGHGRVSVEIATKKYEYQQLKEGQKERFRAINDKFSDSKRRYYFVLTLNSDASIYNRFIQAKKFVAIDDICRSVDLNSEEKEELKKFGLVTKESNQREIDKSKQAKLYFTDLGIIKGWNSVMRLPKPIKPAIAKGSVFIYETTKEINKEVLFNALTKVELAGIGDNRNQGYGSVRINDQFHYQNLAEGK